MKEDYAEHIPFLNRSVELAVANVEKGGGPFGAVIVRDGQIIAESANQVVNNNDPTAHAEIEAIRQASRLLSSFSLEGCTLYSSCEPCPMCLGAIYWAGIDRVFFASDRYDAEKAGFSDALIYREMVKPHESRQLPAVNLRTTRAGDEFKAWDDFEQKTTY